MTAMPLALADSLEAVGLPAIVRQEIDLLAGLLKQILAMPNGQRMAGYDSAARQMRAAGYKMSAGGIRSLAASYRASGQDWHSLIDRRRVPHTDNKLPAAFVQQVKRRFERQHRSSTQAWHDLIKDWRAGKPIPGYAVPPEADPFTGIPHGWSRKNLLRACRSTSFEKAAMRIGLGYAKAKHGPKLFKSRADLYPFSHLAWDDVEHDNFVHLLTRSTRQQCRAVNIGVLDVLSADAFDYGTRPMIKRYDPKQDKMVKDKLKEENVRFLYAKVLYEYGFNPRGTCNVIERGTSTFRESVQRITHDRFKEVYGAPLITFDMGGWAGKEQVVAGMFLGNGGGNPRHKPWLESFHNLLHNRMASLPGQTGPDVERRPEQLDGMQKEVNDLFKIYAVLSESQREKLIFPSLEFYSQFLPLQRDIYEAIAWCTDHDLEGWAACKFLTMDYRFHRGSKEWIPEQEFPRLDNNTQLMLRQAFDLDKACGRPRRLSRREVRLCGMSELVKPPVSIIAEILYEDLAVEKKIRNSYFHIQNEEISAEEILYEPVVRTMDGREIALDQHETYEVVINPFKLDELWVYSGRRGKGETQGGFLGLARRAAEGSMIDPKKNAEALGRYEHLYKVAKAPLIKRHADLARDEAKRVQHNTAVITGPGSDDEARVQQLRRESSPATTDADFIDDAAPLPSVPIESSTSELNDTDFL
jgi:hypothetical protein